MVSIDTFVNSKIRANFVDFYVDDSQMYVTFNISESNSAAKTV